MAAMTEATVAIVDDEPSVLDLYASWLSGRYTVRRANGGAEALRVIDGSVDVILLDRRMPDFSGKEVLQRLRYRGSEAMVALVTAIEPTTDVAALPFDEYMTKPNTRPEVVSVVESLLQRAEYDRREQRCFSLASKVAVLRTAVDEESLATNPEFDRLQERLDDAMEGAGLSLDRIMDESRAANADL